MSARRGLRAWILAGIVTLALAGGFAGTQIGHSVARGVSTHQVSSGPGPIWPPAEGATTAP